MRHEDVAVFCCMQLCSIVLYCVLLCSSAYTAFSDATRRETRITVPPTDQHASLLLLLLNCHSVIARHISHVIRSVISVMSNLFSVFTDSVVLF